MKCARILIPILTLFALAACHDNNRREASPPPQDWTGVRDAIVAALPPPVPAEQGPVYVMLREQGSARKDMWHEGAPWSELVPKALAATFAAASSRVRDRVDGVEVCLTYNYRAADPTKDRGDFTNVHRGVRGMELSVPGRTERYSPTTMLATNRDFRKLIERVNNPNATARIFDAYQFLLTREAGAWKVHPMLRGNTLVTMDRITEANVAQLARGMSDWLVRQVHDDGRMTYKYWPSSGEESSGNNMIRQFMATVCLGRVADFYDDAAARDAQDRNLDYNFGRFYRERNELGYIEFEGKAKLGAAALAALALVERPDTTQYAEQRQRLILLTRHLQQPDGGFRTFYIPPDRTDNQNFYPGEALLLWGVLLERSDDPGLLEAFMASFTYYRAWHLANRNPAFIPWHTQAYCLVWQKTQHPDLAAFIFEMNDWLLGLQEWDNAVYPDTRGRFYDSDRPNLGPPHASSTGVYLEGLIDAFALAKEFGDTKRADDYRRAICRGIRSLMQLQFADDIDMFYVFQREPVQGGLRTTVYNNEIRVDNIQHGLMALLKILKTFEQDDYEAGSN